jgi:hypothetical protein
MQGRWTIHRRGDQNPGGYVRNYSEALGFPMPVVPCDDAAIERSAERLLAYRYSLGPAQAKSLLAECRRDVETVLRAAGETPDA